MASDDFAAFLDASLGVLRRTLLEAHQAENIQFESSQERLVSELQQVKRDFQPTGRPSLAASVGASSWTSSRVSFKQTGLVDEDEDPDAEESDKSENAEEWHKRILSNNSDEQGKQTSVQEEQAKAMQQRLQVRLNVLSASALMSGRSLHDAVGALGLTSYTVEEMNTLVKALAKYIDLKLVKKEDPKNLQRSKSSTSVFSAQGPDDLKAIWKWPVASERPTHTVSRSTENSMNLSGSMRDSPKFSFESEKSEETNGYYNVVPAKALMDLFITKDAELPKRVFGQQRVLQQFQAMREILVAGDTNRLVAELTFVRINDLAAPPDALDPLFYIEPVVAVLILVNGIMIGFQTDPVYEMWTGWPYIEFVFAVLLILECIVRFSLSGCKNFFCGPDWHWNLFDIFLVLTAVTDVGFQMVLPEQDADMAGASLLRFCRLIRLVRVVKVFRLNYMKELRLMVKGLVGGLRTLLLSFALLFAVLYVISGFATMTLGRDVRTVNLGLQKHFENIPQSMFTAFRCFSGECFADSGVPIASVLASEMGFSFVICYVLSFMLVSMGIFNVILAVYVDITMRAAKETEISTAEQYSRESIRIARTTRDLLKKFSEAYRVFHDKEESDRATVKALELSTGEYHDDEHIDNIAITKELFLLVIQDQRVQQLMNDLDLPADRANLFEVIDADGSGTLHVTELVQGLLKIRGELTKSDTVAVLLTSKAVYEMVAELKAEQQSFREALLGVFAAQEALRKSLSKTSHGSTKPLGKYMNPKVNLQKRIPTQTQKVPSVEETSPANTEIISPASSKGELEETVKCVSVMVPLGD